MNVEEDTLEEDELYIDFAAQLKRGEDPDETDVKINAKKRRDPKEVILSPLLIALKAQKIIQWERQQKQKEARRLKGNNRAPSKGRRRNNNRRRRNRNRNRNRNKNRRKPQAGGSVTIKTVPAPKK